MIKLIKLITCSAFSDVLNPIFQKMVAIKWMMFLFKIYFLVTTESVEEILWSTTQKVLIALSAAETCNETDKAYMST